MFDRLRAVYMKLLETSECITRRLSNGASKESCFELLDFIETGAPLAGQRRGGRRNAAFNERTKCYTLKYKPL